MLKAKLPTQQELTSLYKEVELLRRDKKLKDDTINFLQKEKEAIQRQVTYSTNIYRQVRGVVMERDVAWYYKTQNSTESDV